METADAAAASTVPPLRATGGVGLIVIAVALTLLKLYLDSGLSVRGEMMQWVDDGLYAQQAQWLLDGKWLGPYGQVTLVKSPFYPMWIALVHLAGVPLLLAQSALYALAAGLFADQVRRLGAPRAIALLLYVVLLFNPFVEVRILREGIYGALLLLVFAAFADLHRRTVAGRPSAWLSGMLAGIALSALWLTREEAAIVAPSVAVLVAGIGIGVLAQRAGVRILLRRAAPVAVPFVVLGAALAAVAGINQHYYGVFRINDHSTGPFPLAAGALMRVRHDAADPSLVAPLAVREQVYRVSPHFARLRPYFDGTEGSYTQRERWKQQTCMAMPGTCPDFGGVWVFWTLRQAVDDLGLYASAEAADRFYEGIARDIDRACENRQLDCAPLRASIVPRLASEHWPDLARTAGRGFRHVLAVPIAMYVHDPEATSFADRSGHKFLTTLTRERVMPPFVAPRAASGTEVSPGDRRKLNLLLRVVEVYQLILPLLVYGGLAGLALAWGTVAVRRTWPHPMLVLSSALTLVWLVRLAMLAYIDMTMFLVFHGWPAYITPLYPMLIAGSITAIVSAWLALRRRAAL